MSAGKGDDVFRLLIVCTANQCRSPMAQVLAAEQLERRGVDAAVVSAGTMPGGAEASKGAVRAMARRDLDLTSHRSQQLDRDTIEAADLVITMERRHIATVAELSITAVERTFTLRELAELSLVVGPRDPQTSVARWVQRANAMRLPSTVLAVGTEHDIDDPMGGPNRAYRRTAEMVDEMLDTVFTALFPQG